MHDIGKVGTPDHILLKPGRLTPDEFEIMKRHAGIGAAILDGSPARLLQVGAQIAGSHHEKFDGSGYPRGLAGEDIPLFGRICALADVFDALTTRRPYKPPFSNEKAMDIMQKGRGTHFDPALYDVFLDGFPGILAIQKEYLD